MSHRKGNSKWSNSPQMHNAILNKLGKRYYPISKSETNFVTLVQLKFPHFSTRNQKLYELHAKFWTNWGIQLKRTTMSFYFIFLVGDNTTLMPTSSRNFGSILIDLDLTPGRRCELREQGGLRLDNWSNTGKKCPPQVFIW